MNSKTGLHSELSRETPSGVEGFHRDRGLRTAGKLGGLQRVSAQTDSFQRCTFPTRALAELRGLIKVPARYEVRTSRGHAPICKGKEKVRRRPVQIGVLKRGCLFERVLKEADDHARADRVAGTASFHWGEVRGAGRRAPRRKRQRALGRRGHGESSWIR